MRNLIYVLLGGLAGAVIADEITSHLRLSFAGDWVTFIVCVYAGLALGKRACRLGRH